MSDRLTELGDANVVAVTFADHDRLDAHRRHLDLPFPIVSDPERALYERFGLSRGRLRDIWNPGTLRMYTDLIRKGRRTSRPTEDTRQLGGDFVLDSELRLVWGYRPRSPDDRPSVDALVEAVRATNEDTPR